MRTRLSLLVLLGLLLVAGPVDAGKFKFKAASVTVELPKGWKTQDDGGTVTFVSKDGSLAINLTATTGVTLDQAWDLLMQGVGGVVTGFSADKKAGVLSGMSGYVGAGSGTMNGVSVECLVAAVETGSGTMTIFALGEVGKYEKHEKDMNKVLNGIKAVVVAASVNKDDVYEAMKKDAQKFADKVAAAISKNDAKAFAKLVSKKGIAFSSGDSETVVKSAAIPKQVKAAGSVAKFLAFPSAGTFYAWGESVELDEGKSFSLYRGPQDGVVTYLYIQKVKGKWQITGSYFEDHGAFGEMEGE